MTPTFNTPPILSLFLPRYLEYVLGYLSSYLERVHPLLDQKKLKGEVNKGFEEKWNQGNFPGWRVSDTMGGGWRVATMFFCYPFRKMQEVPWLSILELI